jgi:hypothetical protein
MSIRNSFYDISLRVTHPSIDPAEITRNLGVQPAYSYKVGSMRSTPKGNRLPGLNKKTFWFARFHDKRELGAVPLSDAIREINGKLLFAGDFLRLLNSSGGQTEYFIGLFIDGGAGDKLDWALLAQCADLKIDIALDLYGGGVEGRNLQL